MEDDVVQVVDVVVKTRGVARLTRLTEPGDIAAALSLLADRARRERDRAATGEPEEAEPADAAGSVG
jgi:hypothetical protein